MVQRFDIPTVRFVYAGEGTSATDIHLQMPLVAIWMAAGRLIKKVEINDEAGIDENLQAYRSQNEQSATLCFKENHPYKGSLQVDMGINPETASAFLSMQTLDDWSLAPVYFEMTTEDEISQHKLYELVRACGIKGHMLGQIGRVLFRLTRLFFRADLIRATIGALLLTESGEVMADNIVLEMDDAALYRQERFLEPYPALDFNPQVREAQQLGLVYKPVDPRGEVGIIASGMGLVLASVDYVIQAGMSVQGCVILGGGLSEERMASSIRMMLKIQKVEGLLVNLFGGVNSCEIMAKGIITGLEDSQRSPVMIIKMTGHDQEEGWRILEESGSVLVKSPSSEQAVAHLVRLMQKERKFSI